uniref:Uncharacterized protein n=1 Tax=Rhizophora mucronata TaxID=61149 RepID=A0A2P2Q9N6_RHIMU
MYMSMSAVATNSSVLISVLIACPWISLPYCTSHRDAQAGNRLVTDFRLGNIPEDCIFLKNLKASNPFSNCTNPLIIEFHVAESGSKPSDFKCSNNSTALSLWPFSIIPAIIAFHVIKFLLLFSSLNILYAQGQQPHLEYMSTRAVPTVVSYPNSVFIIKP